VLGTPGPEVIKRLRHGAKNNPIKTEFSTVKGCGISCLMQHAGPHVVDLLEKMLEYDPQKRITAAHCIQHPYFDDFMDVIEEVRRDRRADENHIRAMEDAWRESRGLRH